MIIPETFFTVHEHLILFGASCLFGVILGVFYDFFRTLRLIFPHKYLMVLAEDVVFMTCYAVFISSFTSAAARGEFRFFYIFGNLIGFILYIVTAGNVVTGFTRRLISLLHSALRFIMLPLRKIYVSICEKGRSKFVENSKNPVKHFKNFPSLLLMRRRLLYNIMVNIKRKNVANVGEKNKSKAHTKEKTL